MVVRLHVRVAGPAMPEPPLKRIAARMADGGHDIPQPRW